MKKKIFFILMAVLLIAVSSGCSKKEKTWNDEDINESLEVEIDEYRGLDRNLEGVLYDEKTKEEGAVPIVIYSNMPKYMKVEPHNSFALEKNINIDYLLKTICAHCADNKVEIKGYVLGDVATVNLPDEEMFMIWLVHSYPDDVSVYNEDVFGESKSRQDVSYNAHCFTLNVMEIIDKTLRENLGVKTVVFKTLDDESFYRPDDSLCRVNDGVFFNSKGLPRYYPSKYNYYGNKSFNMILKELKEINPDIESLDYYEQLDFINSIICEL